MTETRKLAAILAADVVGYSRLAADDEERTLARLRALWGDLFDPAVVAHRGRLVKRLGDGALVEFRSAVDAVRCAIEVQTGMADRNAGIQKDRRIEFRIGIHIGDVVEETDGDLMGDGVNIAARLEGIGQPGAICLSEDAYRQVRAHIDVDVTELGEQRLKNMREPVRAYAIQVGLRAPPRTPAAKPRRSRGRSLLLTLVAAIAVIVAAGAWYAGSGPTPRPPAPIAVVKSPGHLSLVVLPFVNQSGDPKQDYFANGITDNLTIELSRLRNSFIIAHNTAFTFKDRNLDAREIGRQLDVRYVLEGAVQRDGNRVRVSVQLVDAATNAALWADRFDEDISDLFKLQDRIVARLANSVGIELVKAEAARSAHSTDPDAIDFDMRGAVLLQQTPTREANQAARAWFEQALARDPNDADALAGNAMTYLFDFAFGWGNSATDYDAMILGQADRAVALAPGNVKAYAAKSFYLYISNRPTESLGAANAGLAIDPNYAPLYAARRGAELSLGRYDAAKADIEQAMRLSPRDPDLGAWHMYLGDAELGPGHFDAAIAEYRRAIDAGYRTFIPYADMAAALALAGRNDEAKAALAEAKRLNPLLTVKWSMAHAPDIPNLFDGLRKAGLAENDKPTPITLVVLPFVNAGGDPQQDYRADALTDAVITDLARLPGTIVIARGTAATYRGKPIDAKAIGAELGVRYALEGSAQPTGDRTRIDAKLLDTATGAPLWSAQFNDDTADLGDATDMIVAGIGRTLQRQPSDIAAAKIPRAPSSHPDARALALRCRSAEAATAEALCEQALAIDPNDFVALTTLSLGLLERVVHQQSTDRTADTNRAALLVARAFTAGPNDAAARAAQALLSLARGQYDDSIAEAERALVLDPSRMAAYDALCGGLLLAGRADSVLTCTGKAMRLSPRDPRLPHWRDLAGQADLMQGHDDKALAEFRGAAPEADGTSSTTENLVATMALTGNDFQAHEALHHYLARPNPQAKTIAGIEARDGDYGSPAFRAMRARIDDGLRRAGMPER